MRDRRKKSPLTYRKKQTEEATVCFLIDVKISSYRLADAIPETTFKIICLKNIDLLQEKQIWQRNKLKFGYYSFEIRKFFLYDRVKG